MGMIDMSGEPRSDEELDEAIHCIEVIMVKHMLVLPFLTVHALTIRDCLLELKLMRKVMSSQQGVTHG